VVLKKNHIISTNNVEFFLFLQGNKISKDYATKIIKGIAELEKLSET